MFDNMEQIFDSVVIDYGKLDRTKDYILSFYKTKEDSGCTTIDYGFVECPESVDDKFRGKPKKSTTDTQTIVNYIPHTNSTLNIGSQLKHMQKRICNLLNEPETNWSPMTN
jgi:hypothetical protein